MGGTETSVRASLVLPGALGLSLATTAAAAQALGTFAWQAEPYCNVVRFTVTPDGPAYRLTGTDDQCGAGAMPAATQRPESPRSAVPEAPIPLEPQRRDDRQGQARIARAERTREQRVRRPCPHDSGDLS